MSNQESKPNQGLTRATKSKYAAKIKRKLGKGKVDPRWMWWIEREQVKPV